ncbi:hypothetical protein ACHAXR_001655 [Thalassiosira sp. AJA248-18]
MSPIIIIPRRNQIHLTRTHLSLSALIVLSIIWVVVQLQPLSKTQCLVSHGTYAGFIYAKPKETLGNKCLVESPWMRLAIHSVRLPANGKIIDDWLWIDYHDRINVLVEAPRSTRTNGSQSLQEKEFMILSQTKYALNQMSLAVVGGIIEVKEDAKLAAQREVEEELSVICQSWKALGKFRTDVNRGMGWVHPYLARDCTYVESDIGIEKNANSNEVGGHDTEKQGIKTMKLSQVKKAVMDGKFVEVQWSNTVALAMLHLSSEG